MSGTSAGGLAGSPFPHSVSSTAARRWWLRQEDKKAEAARLLKALALHHPPPCSVGQSESQVQPRFSQRETDPTVSCNEQHI